ncbi:DUF3592 domain-containing protein [Trichocoleus sp. FACHB-46]|uniref:DUF3592 domain-containing protein n=1 Tax=Trichocoleus desertorum GB2-A4 TaxID=2933944 RepID=A0ABV0JHU5_9CYAN
MFASVAGMLLIDLPSFYKSEVEFQSKAIAATGTVIGVAEKKEYSGGGGIVPLTVTTKYIATVEFQTNQRNLVEFTASSACSSQRDCENKLVPVLYNPDFPSKARVDSGATPEGMAQGRLVLSTVFLVADIAFLGMDLGNSG